MKSESARRPTDRYAGAMLALACGDALGAPAEFLSKEQLVQRHGHLTEMKGGGHFQWRPGEWTDDTGMTLCVGEGILDRPDDPVEAVGERFLAWLETAKDVGGTISSALLGYQELARSQASEGLATKDLWAEASRHTPEAQAGRAAGNGSLMRTLPVALAYPDRAQMLTVSARISAMTHWDPQAELSCAIYCLWIRHMLRGLALAEAWQTALDEGRAVQAEGRRDFNTPGPDPIPDEFWQRLETAVDRPVGELQPHDGYAGYVLDCLEAVVWSCHQDERTDEVLIRTVNLAGETDTMAAIAGGVMGVTNGLEGLREDWLAALFERDRLEYLGRKLASLRHARVYSKPSLPAFDFQLVAPGIQIGRNPLSELDIEKLMDGGVGLILDLREEKEWAETDRFGAEAVAVQARTGLERLHVPIIDGEAPSFEALDRVWEALNDSTKESVGVYLHCRAGIERTGASLVAFLARSGGLTYDQALQRLQGDGVGIHPRQHQADAVRAWLADRANLG